MTKRTPRPPRKPPLTAWGRFLVAQRLERGWTQDDAFDHFRDEFGWGEDSRASYGNLERGTAAPDADKQRVFLDAYGFDALPEEPPIVVDASDRPAIIAALDRQSTAMENLARVLGELAETQSLRLEKVEAVLDALVQRAIQDGDGRPAPRQTETGK